MTQNEQGQEWRLLWVDGPSAAIDFPWPSRWQPDEDPNRRFAVVLPTEYAEAIVALQQRLTEAEGVRRALEVCEMTISLESHDAFKCAEFPDDEAKRCNECLGCGRTLALQMARDALKTPREVS